MSERARLEAHEVRFLRADARVRRVLKSGYAGRLAFEDVAETLRLLTEVREELRAWKAEVAGRDMTEPREVPP